MGRDAPTGKVKPVGTRPWDVHFLVSRILLLLFDHVISLKVGWEGDQRTMTRAGSLPVLCSGSALPIMRMRTL